MNRVFRLWPALPIGGALALGQEPFALPVYILPALIAFALWRGETRREVITRFAAVAFVYFAITLSWIIHPFLVEPEVHGWMAPFAAVLLPLGLSLFWMAGGLIGWIIHRGLLGWALGLCLAEMARAYLFTGFPWAGFAQGYVDAFPATLVPYIGAHGLTLLTIALSAVLTALIERRRIAIAIAAVASAIVSLPAPNRQTDLTDKTIRLVQPNAPQDQKWDPEWADVFYQRMLEATGAEPEVEAIIWPETALPYLAEYSQPFFEESAGIAGETPLLLGITRSDGATYYNSLYVLGEGGAVSAQYDKRHLVPFGEYIPFGEVFAKLGIYGLAASQGGGYSAGNSQGLVEIDGLGTALALICYEGIFPYLSMSSTRADFILLITNDAWFGPAAGPMQHFAQARLRAMEQGLPVVRVANTGVSAMIDGHGQITAELPLNVTGHLDVALPTPLPPTFFAKWGMTSSFVVLFAVLGMAIAARRSNWIDRTAYKE